MRHTSNTSTAHTGTTRADPAPSGLEPTGPAGTFPELFTAQVERHPEECALVVEDTALSYAELDERANRLGRYLIARGVGPEVPVAVALRRSADQVIALLAVFKAGGAYVPIDPDYPAQRVAYLLADSAPSLILTHSTIDPDLPDGSIEPEAPTQTRCATHSAPRVLLDTARLQAELRSFPGTAPADGERTAPLTLQHPAYIIYTSGSTGQPKGVVVTHRGLGDLVAALAERYAVTPGSRLLQLASPSFDAAIAELGPALLTGATLVLAPAGRASAAGQLPELLRRYGVTHATIPPTLLAAMEPSDLPAELVLTVAGEACAARLVDAFAPGRRMINAYGPTECTVCATMSAPLLPGRGTPTIGAPNPGTQAHVLDAALCPVPVGTEGELYLAGPGLARGYHDRFAMTASRFVANPFGTPGERMYRTGDVVRWTDNGELEFLGRYDDQVKIRGFRIELGEVEATLAALPRVAQAAALAREDRPGHKRLVGYVVPHAESRRTVDPAGIRAELAATLPAHMVPAAIVVLDALPLTANGKLDKKALPAPTLTTPAAGPTAAAPARAPRGEAERVLYGLFRELLSADRVGVDADFFALGGDSIVALQLAARARQAGLALSPRDVFRHRTVAALAANATTATSTPAEHARQPHAGGHTPADFPLLSLDQAEINELETAGPIADVLPLTPLQQGMLFHAAYDPDGEDPTPSRPACTWTASWMRPCCAPLWTRCCSATPTWAPAFPTGRAVRPSRSSPGGSSCPGPRPI